MAADMQIQDIDTKVEHQTKQNFRTANPIFSAIARQLCLVYMACSSNDASQNTRFRVMCNRL